MATSRKDAMLSSASTFACAICQCAGLLQMLSPSDVNQVLVVSCPPGAKSTTLIDDTSSPPGFAASTFDDDWNDVTKRHDTPTFGMAQLKAGFVRLYQLVTALVVQVIVIASDVVSLKDRITAVEGTQTPALVHGRETEALTRQVNKLCERVASQEDRIAGLELSQRAKTDSYKKTIQELTTKLDNMKVDDDNKDALENLCQSFKNFQQSMECQAARITGVKADTARKIALLQSELEGVQAELAAVKMVAVPVNALSASQTAKESQKAGTLASVTLRIEDAEMTEEKLCPLLPVVAQSSACVTVFQDTPAASTSSGGSSITLSNYRKTEETTVKYFEITKEPFTTAHTNVVQPGADKIPVIPVIPMIPIPTIPMERPIPVKDSGKENKPCNSPTTTLQYTKTSQPGAGRSPEVNDKPPTASPRKAQPSAGLPSKISALPKPRRLMLPAPRKSHLPSLAKHVAVVDGDLFSEVKTADRLPGGSETQTEQPKTVKVSPIVTSPLEFALLTPSEKESLGVLPASCSLVALDAALQGMQVDGGDLLMLLSAPNCSNADLSFSAITPIPMKTKRHDNYESIYVPLKERSVDVKPPRSPLKSTFVTLAENEVSLPASSSLAALDAALPLSQGEGDILTLMPGPDYPSVDLSFSAVTPILIKARPHCKRDSIYVSPKKTSTVKPSRRL